MNAIDTNLFYLRVIKDATHCVLYNNFKCRLKVTYKATLRNPYVNISETFVMAFNFISFYIILNADSPNTKSVMYTCIQIRCTSSLKSLYFN